MGFATEQVDEVVGAPQVTVVCHSVVRDSACTEAAQTRHIRIRKNRISAWSRCGLLTRWSVTPRHHHLFVRHVENRV